MFSQEFLKKVLGLTLTNANRPKVVPIWVSTITMNSDSRRRSHEQRKSGSSNWCRPCFRWPEGITSARLLRFQVFASRPSITEFIFTSMDTRLRRLTMRTFLVRRCRLTVHKAFPSSYRMNVAPPLPHKSCLSYNNILDDTSDSSSLRIGWEKGKRDAKAKSTKP
jgi:hypothetical protein